MQFSDGSPYPPSESDISEIPRDLEKEDASEKLSLLPNPPSRPRCITPSDFRDVAEEPGLPKPTFQHCTRRLHTDFSYDYPDMSSELIQPLDKNYCGIVIENTYGDRQRVVEDYQHKVTETTSDVTTATATTESTSSEATATSSSSGTTFTTDEATTTKAATTSEEATSSTEDADATPTIDPNYQPLVQQDPECLEPADGDHGAIDPGTQDDYAEDFSSQEPDGGWEAGADIQHSYKETSHGVVYEYKVNWAQDCITDGDTQDIRWPLGQAGDITAYSLMRDAFEKCSKTETMYKGSRNHSDCHRPLNFPKVDLALYIMTVTEVGCMGVKPNMNIMDHTTPEGKILTNAWNTVISKPGGPQRVYWGLESVEPSMVWCFFDFDSIEQHRRFAEEYGADAVKDIPKICTYGEFSKHIKMVPSSDVLGSPLTEIILAYFPQDISEEKKEALSSKIQEILRQAFPGEARVAHAWGVENDFPARGEDGQPRSVLMGFVGLSHSEAWGTYRQTDAWKEALSSIERLEGCTSIYSFAIRSQHLERLEGF
ncbi:hypothetical protein BFJ66_g9933 [Fusarium oxysporum f. sp. cepae]|nr:hypothetical protein BFJ65_g5588 [Fusarium oxysporum f. sp. cepae]RKK43635.1 hypothetical protein BFJ66_g9933 [Fusarium oxysporum f. sp. cepae]RKK93792.1 hypothetical protein BFJ71_g9365 [Fusarium oxysporum]